MFFQLRTHLHFILSGIIHDPVNIRTGSRAPTTRSLRAAFLFPFTFLFLESVPFSKRNGYKFTFFITSKSNITNVKTREIYGILVDSLCFEFPRSLPWQDAKAATLVHVIDVRLGVADSEVNLVKSVFGATKLLTLDQININGAISDPLLVTSA